MKLVSLLEMEVKGTVKSGPSLFIFFLVILFFIIFIIIIEM